MAVRTIKADERRARLGARHHLAEPAGTVVDVARALVALHGTDPASVYLAARARMRDFDVEVMERALYDDRRLLRMLAMRRTVFTVVTEFAPVVQAACAVDAARRERARSLTFIERAGLGDDAWLREVEEATVAALRARGEAFTADLSDDVPRLKERIALAEGKAYEARPAIANRAAPGRAPSSAGSRSSRGCPAACRASRRSRHGRSWYGSGSPRTVRAPWPTSNGGPASRSRRSGRRSRRSRSNR